MCPQHLPEPHPDRPPTPRAFAGLGATTLSAAEPPAAEPGRRRPAVPLPPRPRSPFAEADFRFAFAAAGVSELGTAVGSLALPLVAVLALGASPAQVGVLATLSTLAFLIIGLPAGAWVDRIRRRRLLIAADLARVALLGSVPVAWATHVLTLAQLDLVALFTGTATVFFDVAAMSFLPRLVGRDRLVAANTALVGMDAANRITGAALGGLLVAALTAPVAVAVDAMSYLGSATLLHRIRAREPKPERPTTRLRADIRAGVRHVVGHPLLRPILVESAWTNLFIQVMQTMFPILFVRELHLPTPALGLFVAAGGLGLLLGSRAARPISRAVGAGRALWLVGALGTPFVLLVPLADHGPLLWVAAAGWTLTVFRVGVHNVLKVSFRQRVTPDDLLGRMNATYRFLLTGAFAAGGALSGALGQLAGVRAALWVGAAGIAVSWLLLFCSPLRGSRDLPP